MNKPTVRLLVKRIAMLSIGPSTLRGQGAKWVVQISREYLSRMKLDDLSKQTVVLLVALSRLTAEVQKLTKGF